MKFDEDIGQKRWDKIQKKYNSAKTPDEKRQIMIDQIGTCVFIIKGFLSSFHTSVQEDFKSWIMDELNDKYEGGE